MIPISIVIPVYNAAPYLRRCLDSVVGQTCRDIEAVCIDDGSTDGSGGILDEYAAKDGRIKVVHQANQGTLVARKNAVERIVGEWCLFLDPDDWLATETCECLLKSVGVVDVDLVSYGFTIHETIALSPDRRKAVDSYFNRPASVCDGRELLARCFVKRDLPWNLIGKMVRTAVCKAAFAEQPKLYSIESEDMYALFHVLARVRSGVIVESRLYNYAYSVGISTKPWIDMQEFSRSLGKVETLAELRSFTDALCAANPDAAKAFQAVEKHVVRSMFTTLAERMKNAEDRHRAFMVLRDSFPPEKIAMVLADTYGSVPMDLAQLLDGCRPFDRAWAEKGVKRIIALFPADVPQRTLRISCPLIDGWRSNGIEVVSLQDGVDVPLEGVDRVMALCKSVHAVDADVVCSFRCDTAGAIWDVLGCRLACGVPVFLCHHGDFTSAMYSHPSVTLYNYEPHWLRLFDGVFAQTALDALAFAAEGAVSYELKPGMLPEISIAAFGGSGAYCRRAATLEELSEMLDLQRRGLRSLHDRRSIRLNRLSMQKAEIEAKYRRLAAKEGL